jgi:hypothetical protein
VKGRLKAAEGVCGGSVGKGGERILELPPSPVQTSSDQCSSQPAAASERWHFCPLFLPRKKWVGDPGVAETRGEGASEFKIYFASSLNPLYRFDSVIPPRILRIYFDRSRGQIPLYPRTTPSPFGHASYPSNLNPIFAFPPVNELNRTG